MPAASHSMHRYVALHTMSVTLRCTQHSRPRSEHRSQEMVLVGGVILWEDIGGDNWMMMIVESDISGGRGMVTGAIWDEMCWKSISYIAVIAMEQPKDPFKATQKQKQTLTQYMVCGT